MKKKNEIVKKENSTSVNACTQEEGKRILKQFATINGTIDSEIQEFGEKFVPKMREVHDVPPEISGKLRNLLFAMETESHSGLVSSVDEIYQGMAKELSTQIIKEYQCETHTEKMLTEIVVNDFIRILDNSRRLNNELNCTNITENRNAYIANISKQTDRAHRQFLSSLFALKQMKVPNIEMNIKTKNAFISQNQQINVDKQNHEINDPK